MKVIFLFFPCFLFRSLFHFISLRGSQATTENEKTRPSSFFVAEYLNLKNEKINKNGNFTEIITEISQMLIQSFVTCHIDNRKICLVNQNIFKM